MNRICLQIFSLSLLGMTFLSGCGEKITFDDQQAIDRAIIEEYVAINNLQGNYTEQGVFYSITKEGSGTATPNLSSQVDITYTGTLLDGTVFDSSDGFPVSFQLYSLIRGWQIGLEYFTKESTGVLVIPSRLAYGVNGTVDGSIPPNTVIRFDIELLDFQ